MNQPVRKDLIAELATRLDALDHLLSRLEEAENRAANADDALAYTRAWQEETQRAIQNERAGMRRQQRALEDLATRAQAAVDALSPYRFLPAEVHELSVELHVLESAGFIARRARKRIRPPEES